MYLLQLFHCSHSTLPLAVCEAPKGPPKIVVLTESKLLVINSKSLTIDGSCDHGLMLNSQSTGRSLMIIGHMNHVAFASHDGIDVFVMTLIIGSRSSSLDDRMSLINLYINNRTNHTLKNTAIICTADKRNSN